MERLLTPRQQKAWEKFSSSPIGARMVERLGLEPAKSREQVMAERISERVDGWIDQFGLAPKRVRHVVRAPRTPWEEPDLSWLKPGECPF